MLNFLKKLDKLQETVIGLNNRNTSFVYEYNKRKHYPLADNKALCKEVLHEHHIPTPETYGIIDGLRNIEKFWDCVKGKDKVVVKPAKGSGGGGILVMNRTGEFSFETPGGTILQKDDIETHIANIIFGVYSFGSGDVALIEKQLIPHEFFKNIYDNGIPDFRIIMLKEHPVLAMLRIPTEESDGKGNLHAGALGVGINLEEGCLTKGFYKESFIDTHPDSGVKFEGMKLPNWEETMAIAQKTAEVFPLKYLGIDIVYDNQIGPMIMEINVRPGLEIQNVNQKGILERVKELKIEL